MKFKNKSSLNLLLASGLLALSLPALAVTGDSDQPVHINSINQSLDMDGNIATFTGNVVITQGTIKIQADKVIVTRPGGDSKKTLVDAYGNPATFYQMQDNGKPVKGSASKLHYNLAADSVELTGKAHVQQLDSNINGDRITYLVKAQKMQAYSQGQSKRVTTVLMPSQLQDDKKSSTPKTRGQ